MLYVRKSWKLIYLKKKLKTKLFAKKGLRQKLKSKRKKKLTISRHTLLQTPRVLFPLLI